jgi:hypothetical protein
MIAIAAAAAATTTTTTATVALDLCQAQLNHYCLVLVGLVHHVSNSSLEDSEARCHSKSSKLRQRIRAHSSSVP